MRCTRPTRTLRQKKIWIHQNCCMFQNAALAQMPMIWFLTTEKQKLLFFYLCSFLFRRWQRRMEWNGGEKRNINCILPFLENKVDFVCCCCCCWWWLDDGAGCVQCTSFMHPFHMPLPNTWCTMKRIVLAIVFCSVFFLLLILLGFVLVSVFATTNHQHIVSRDPNWVLSHIARQHANLMTF